MAAAQFRQVRMQPPKRHDNDAAESRPTVIIMPFTDVEEEILWDRIMLERGLPI